MEPQMRSLHKDWIQEITATWPKAPLEASRPSPCWNQGQRWCQTRLLRTLSCSVVKISIDRDVRASLGHCSSVQLHSLTPGWLIPVSIFPALPFWSWSSEKHCWISQAVPLPAWVPAHQMSQFLFCEHVLLSFNAPSWSPLPPLHAPERSWQTNFQNKTNSVLLKARIFILLFVFLISLGVLILRSWSY